MTKPNLADFCAAAQIILMRLEEGNTIRFSHPTKSVQELFEAGLVLIDENFELSLTDKGIDFLIQRINERYAE